MKFQALLLFLVIIISLLLSPARRTVFKEADLPESSEEAPIIVQETDLTTNLENPFFIFFKDSYFLITDKIKSSRKNFNFAVKNFQQNFASVKNIFSGDFKKQPDNSQSEYLNLNPSYSLVSGAEIKTPNVFCDFLENPDLTAEIAFVDYFDTSSEPDLKEPVFELNIKKRWPIASLTKIMTSIIVLEKMDLEQGIVMSETAVNTEGMIGNFKQGEIFKLEDLLKAMLISSSNDAAVAVVEIFNAEGGNFINEMQKKAAELGMFSTTYFEPTGLSYINQSTAEDLIKLVSYVYSNHPEILEISRQKETIITELRSNKSRKIFNVNNFAGEEDFIGGKTGFIDEAGRNLIAFFKINDRMILSIVLGSDDAFKDTDTIKDAFESCNN